MQICPSWTRIAARRAAGPQRLDLAFGGSDSEFQFLDQGNVWASEVQTTQQALGLFEHLGNFAEPSRPRGGRYFNWCAVHVRPPALDKVL
jgi:hypothetical protein